MYAHVEKYKRGKGCEESGRVETGEVVGQVQVRSYY